ncbi:MAG TPA: Mur ligase domain-containing protein, partial [Solirubrobacterales bacterium]|nr:Mur ligase domain-containing protein [Solirubrobacterales bacterium]
MELGELLRASGVAAELSRGGSVEIRDLAYDSRRAGPGTLLFCFPGERTDGHDFAPAAVEAGASALVVERPLDLDVPQARVEDARAAMAPIAATFNGDPTSELGV